VAAITYDSREILRNFAATYKLDYPLLSDAGSKVIHAFGIFNTNIPADHPMMYGIPWPGDFLIASDGTVRDKLFLPNYEYRPSASQVLLRHFNDGVGNSVQIKSDTLEAVVTLSADRCFPGQEIGLALDLRVKSGWHVYGKPVPGNYQATALELQSPLIGEQSLELPAPQLLHLKALNETLPVYSGEVRAIGKVGIKWSPPMPAPFLKPLGEMIAPAPYKINGTLRFQACSDAVCETPQAIAFELPLTIAARVPQAPKPPG
jgi:hypothetical protein